MLLNSKKTLIFVSGISYEVHSEMDFFCSDFCIKFCIDFCADFRTETAFVFDDFFGRFYGCFLGVFLAVFDDFFIFSIFVPLSADF